MHPRPGCPQPPLSICAASCCTQLQSPRPALSIRLELHLLSLTHRKEGVLHLFHFENNFRGGLLLVCPVTCLLRNQAGGDGVMGSFLKSYVAAVGAKIVPKGWRVIIRGGEVEINKAGVTHCRFFPPALGVRSRCRELNHRV